MYYPYFRGRQNELFCLRTMVQKNILGQHIVPIIEPVRFSRALFDTLSVFIEAGHEIALVKNPKVGSYWKEYKRKCQEIADETDVKKREDMREEITRLESIFNDEKIISAYLMDESVAEKVSDGTIKSDQCFLINADKEYYDYYNHGILADAGAKMTFIPNDLDFKDAVQGNVALLEDSFQKKKRNIDYLQNEDQLFGKNHLTYRKHGYQGFADYSIVGGKEYEESGFAPVAVAIHILYFDEHRQLRIHHFVSDTNNSIADPARKFAEAMLKLKEWVDLEKPEQTLGLKTLLNYFSEGRYPGLGVVKRYSIMHHLELMALYLGGNE